MWSTCLFALIVLSRGNAYLSPCEELRATFKHELEKRRKINATFPVRRLIYDNCEVPLEVWGGGGGPRAAAAALWVMLHIGLFYDTVLKQETPDLCCLGRNSCSRGVVALAAKWPCTQCDSSNSAPSFLSSLQTKVSVPYGPLLLAYVPRPECISNAASWTFYANIDSGIHCDFLLNNSNSSIVVLCRNDSSFDAKAIQELQSRIESLPLEIQTFESDQLLRKTMYALREKRKAFLFVDEDIWKGEPAFVRVQTPPCADRICPADLLGGSAVRVGDGYTIQVYAPPVAKLVRGLNLAPTDLRNILHHEVKNAHGNITEAACLWAFNNITRFYNLMYIENSASAAVYTIAVYICEDDPDIELHKSSLSVVYNQLFNVTKVNYDYKMQIINCSDSEELRESISNLSYKPRVVGAVALSSGQGVPVATHAAKERHLPLVLMGPSVGLPLNPMVRSASPLFEEFLRALHYFFGLCKWSRLAILSDDSSYAANFADALMVHREFIYRNEKVTRQNVITALKNVRNVDAKVIFINANWNISARIVCEALELGMSFAWVVREWRPAKCADRATVVSLGTSWRGAENLPFANMNSSLPWQYQLRTAWRQNSKRNFTGPLYSASLVDAVIHLTMGFDRFLTDHRKHKFDLRGSASKMSRYFDETKVTGVTSDLEYKNYTMRNRLIYIERWIGLRLHTVAAWRITATGVEAYWPNAAVECSAIIGGSPVADRAACLTLSTGDRFYPRCHDLAIFLSIVFMAAAVLALWIARRARLSRMRRRDLALRAALLERRRRNVAALGTHLVDRGSIKLLHEIGSGYYGRVHFAELRRADGDTVGVAAKQPREGTAPEEEQDFLREACVLAPLRHAHVVRLVGVCVWSGPPLVLMEHARHRDLRRYLGERRCGPGREPSPALLTRLSGEAAAALAYLAGRRVVHRDVRAANCLVDDRRSLKLADFGMARELDAAEPEYASTRRALFPVLWMAPESLESGVFSPASDIWALGVLILEVATLGERPFGKWSVARVLRYVSAGGHPPLPPDLSVQTREVVMQCWERCAEQRPDAAQLHAWLSSHPNSVCVSRLPPHIDSLPDYTIPEEKLCNFDNFPLYSTLRDKKEQEASQ